LYSLLVDPETRVVNLDDFAHRFSEKNLSIKLENAHSIIDGYMARGINSDFVKSALACVQGEDNWDEVFDEGIKSLRGSEPADALKVNQTAAIFQTLFGGTKYACETDSRGEDVDMLLDYYARRHAYLKSHPVHNFTANTLDDPEFCRRKLEAYIGILHSRSEEMQEGVDVRTAKLNKMLGTPHEKGYMSQTDRKIIELLQVWQILGLTKPWEQDIFESAEIVFRYAMSMDAGNQAILARCIEQVRVPRTEIGVIFDKQELSRCLSTQSINQGMVRVLAQHPIPETLLKITAAVAERNSFAQIHGLNNIHEVMDSVFGFFQHQKMHKSPQDRNIRYYNHDLRRRNVQEIMQYLASVVNGGVVPTILGRDWFEKWQDLQNAIKAHYTPSVVTDILFPLSSIPHQRIIPHDRYKAKSKLLGIEATFLNSETKKPEMFQQVSTLYFNRVFTLLNATSRDEADKSIDDQNTGLDGEYYRTLQPLVFLVYRFAELLDRNNSTSESEKWDYRDRVISCLLANVVYWDAGAECYAGFRNRLLVCFCNALGNMGEGNIREDDEVFTEFYNGFDAGKASAKELRKMADLLDISPSVTVVNVADFMAAFVDKYEGDYSEERVWKRLQAKFAVSSSPAIAAAAADPAAVLDMSEQELQRQVEAYKKFESKRDGH
ncbi:MAG: hypothetical protein K6C34_00365, partial [Alphaproteobacteria bacterium]|nr:hypothetical protein [Alphaproteobacteria bacterium]